MKTDILFTGFQLDKHRHEFGKWRVKAAMIEPGWTVFFEPTRNERQVCILFHVETLEEAIALTRLISAALDAGECEACGHDHLGFCQHVTNYQDGFVDRCMCPGPWPEGLPTHPEYTPNRG